MCVCVLQSELSQLIHSLSDKARSGTEFIARLKSMQERIEVSLCSENAGPNLPLDKTPSKS